MKQIRIDTSNTQTGNKPFYTSLSKDDQKQLVKAVKALNERLRDLNRRGMTSSLAYENLKSWVSSMPNNMGSTGVPGDSSTMLIAKQTYKLTPKQIERTLAIYNATDNTGKPLVSAGGDIRRVNELYKAGNVPTPNKRLRPDVFEAFNKKKIYVANMQGKLHEIITQKTELYYGSELEKAVHKKENLTLNEAFAFFRLVENEEESRQKNLDNYKLWELNAMNKAGENS